MATLSVQTSAPEFQYLALASIVPSKTNPRRTFDAVYISELAASVREVGIIEPLIVRPFGEEKFEIVAGECRYRAAKEAQLAAVPVRVRPFTDEQALEVQVIENLHRKDLHPLEALKDEEKPMELDRARAIADVARVIVDSSKVEVDFLKVTGALRSTGFLPAEEEAPRPKLAAGAVRR